MGEENDKTVSNQPKYTEVLTEILNKKSHLEHTFNVEQ